MQSFKKYLPGMAICVFIAAVSSFLASFHAGSFSFEIIGAPVFAIVIGMIITMLVPQITEKYKDGVKFTSKKILQWAVIILGFTLNLGTIAKVGTQSLPVIISTISISLITAYVMMKFLKLDQKVSVLIGVGSSICGGSAVAAAAPVIDADEKEVAQAISVIFLFNVLAALIFPTLGHAIGLGSEGFAIFAGTAVNDTSSVTAAASTAENIYHTEGILSSAVTVKLTRTLAIIPITLCLALYRAKNESSKEQKFSIAKIFPFFILYFAGAAIITTIAGLLPESSLTHFYMTNFISSAKWLAKFFIAMAMAAIGLNTNLIDLVKKGAKPITMGLCCWTAISIVSLLVQRLTGIYYTNL